MKSCYLLVLAGLVTSLSGQPKSPEGIVAYLRDGREIRLVAPDGTNDRLLWQHPRTRPVPGIAGIHSLAWHPGGESVVFSSDHENERATPTPAASDKAPPTYRRADPGPNLPARSMEAVSAYKRREYESAKRIAQEVLRVDPRQKEALFAVAASAYETTDFELFERAAPAAVRNGAGMSFTLAHHHTLTGGHPATLGIKQSTIVFVPAVKDCNQRAFEEQLANIVSSSQTATAKGEVFLTLKIRDSQGKVRTLNFADPGSTVDKSGGLPALREPADAVRRLQALATVIATAANPSVPAYTNNEEGGLTVAPVRSDSNVPDVHRPYSGPNANPEQGGTASAPITVAPGARSRVPDSGSVLLCKDPARLDFAMENARNGNSYLALQALRHDAFLRVNGPASLEVRELELKSSWPKVFVRVLDGDLAGRTGWVLLSELKDLKQP